MLVYNIKRSINILGVSDLIAKLKNSYKKACFVFITNYFRLYKDSIKISYNFKTVALERLYCRLGVCVM
jgi:hypothetical protein